MVITLWFSVETRLYREFMFPKLSILYTDVVITKGNLVVTDSSNNTNATMSRTGSVTLPKADIAATGVITTKGGISVKDSGGVEKSVRVTQEV